MFTPANSSSETRSRLQLSVVSSTSVQRQWKSWNTFSSYEIHSKNLQTSAIDSALWRWGSLYSLRLPESQDIHNWKEKSLLWQPEHWASQPRSLWKTRSWSYFGMRWPGPQNNKLLQFIKALPASRTVFHIVKHCSGKFTSSRWLCFKNDVCLRAEHLVKIQNSINMQTWHFTLKDNEKQLLML